MSATVQVIQPTAQPQSVETTSQKLYWGSENDDSKLILEIPVELTEASWFETPDAFVDCTGTKNKSLKITNFSIKTTHKDSTYLK